MEQAMKVQDVMLQTLARKIAAEIQGITRTGQELERCARPSCVRGISVPSSDAANQSVVAIAHWYSQSSSRPHATRRRILLTRPAWAEMS